jgi:hypothetical protein
MEDLPGTFEVERPRSRRWVAIVALTIPVIAVVLSAAWFVRAFVAPPTVMIPATIEVASAPYVADVQGSDTQNAAVADARVRLADKMTESTGSTGSSVYTPTLPMIGSIAAAPQAPASPPAMASVAPPSVAAPRPMSSEQQPAVTSQPVAAAPDVQTEPRARAANPEPDTQAEIEPGEPIQGPIPVPPRKPRFTVAHVVSGPVPLPRPRPTEATAKPEPEAQNFERHGVQ